MKYSMKSCHFLNSQINRLLDLLDSLNIQDIFYLNDFNWNVTPSNHETKEFELIKKRIESILKTKTYVFDYQKDEGLGEKIGEAIIKNVAFMDQVDQFDIINDGTYTKIN